MRARTSQSTTGSSGSNSGLGVLGAVDVSTAIERGGRACEGVRLPGVAGGVKAGLIMEGGGPCECAWFVALLCIACLSSSAPVEKSKPSRLEGWGEWSGGNRRDACAGSSGIARMMEGKLKAARGLACLRRTGTLCACLCGRICGFDVVQPDGEGSQRG
jgi:hypothetical protein